MKVKNMPRSRKKKRYGYDVTDDFDRGMVLDLPFEQLNKAGRKAKRKHLLSEL